MNGQPKNFREIVCETYAFLKSARTAQSLADRRLALVGYEGDLVPVCEYHAGDRDLIADLAAWRQVNNWAYPTQFQPTFESTASWLRTQVLDAEDRIMFLVCERPTRTVVGHVGFAQASNENRSIKLDNCMRGVKAGCRGIMSGALRTLISWPDYCLGAELIHVPVFGDNVHMLAFLRRLGFQEAELIALRRQEESGRICYRPLAVHDVAPPDKYHQRMIYRPGGVQSAA
jgi:RimJ/RimL family protein N-acetyltransferase